MSWKAIKYKSSRTAKTLLVWSLIGALLLPINASVVFADEIISSPSGDEPVAVPPNDANKDAERFDEVLDQRPQVEDEYRRENVFGAYSADDLDIEGAVNPKKHQNGCNADQFYNFVCGTKATRKSQNSIAEEILSSARENADISSQMDENEALTYKIDELGNDKAESKVLYGDPEVKEKCKDYFPERKDGAAYSNEMALCVRSTQAYRKFVNDRITKGEQYAETKKLFEKAKTIAVAGIKRKLAETYRKVFESQLIKFLNSDYGKQAIESGQATKEKLRLKADLLVRAAIGRVIRHFESIELNDDVMAVCSADQVDTIVSRRNGKGPLITVCPGMMEGITSGKYQGEKEAALMSALSRAIAQAADSCEMDRLSVGHSPPVNLGNLLENQRSCVVKKSGGKAFTVSGESEMPNAFSEGVRYDAWLQGILRPERAVSVADLNAPHCSAPLTQNELQDRSVKYGRKEQTNSLISQELSNRIFAKWFKEQGFKNQGKNKQRNAVLRAAFAPYCTQKNVEGGPNLNVASFMRDFIAKDQIIREALACDLKTKDKKVWKKRKRVTIKGKPLYLEGCHIEDSIADGMVRYFKGLVVNPDWNVTPEEEAVVQAATIAIEDSVSEAIKNGKAADIVPDLDVNGTTPNDAQLPSGGNNFSTVPADPMVSIIEELVPADRSPRVRHGRLPDMPWKYDEKDVVAVVKGPNGEEVKLVDVNGDGYPDAVDHNGDGTTEHVFSDADKNFDGVVDADEKARYLKENPEAAGDLNKDGKVDQTERDADLNNDGVIDLREKDVYAKEQPRKARDLNGDGKYDKNEETYDINKDGIIDEQEKRADKNGDGVVDADEKKKFAEEHKLKDLDKDGKVSNNESGFDINQDDVVSHGERKADVNNDGTVDSDERARYAKRRPDEKIDDRREDPSKRVGDRRSQDDEKNRPTRCFKAEFSGEDFEDSSDEMRNYCKEVKRRDVARKSAMVKAQARCAEVTQLPFTRQQHVNACKLLGREILDLNLWDQPHVIKEDGFGFSFQCQSRATSCDNLENINAYYGEAALLGIESGDLKDPAIKPGTQDAVYLQMAKRWAAQQMALGESSPGVYPVGKKCLEISPPYNYVESTCNQDGASNLFSVKRDVDYVPKLAGADTARFSCEFNCSCDARGCEALPVKPNFVGDSRRFNVEARADVPRVEGHLKAYSITEIIQFSDSYKSGTPVTAPAPAASNADIQKPAPGPVQPRQAERTVNDQHLYLNEDYMQRRLSARNGSLGEAYNACMSSVERLPEISKASGQAVQSPLEYFCKGQTDYAVDFEHFGSNNRKMKTFLVRRGVAPDDFLFEYKCVYDCKIKECASNGTKKKDYKGECAKAYFVREVKKDVPEIETREQYVAAKAHDFKILYSDMHQSCVIKRPKKFEQIQDRCGTRSSKTISIRGREVYQTREAGDLTGKVTNGKGLLFTCDYECDCKTGSCKTPHESPRVVDVTGSSEGGWLEDIKLREAKPAYWPK